MSCGKQTRGMACSVLVRRSGGLEGVWWKGMLPFPSGWGPSKGRVSAASPLAFLEEALVPRDRLVSLEEVPVSLVGGVHLSQ